MAETGDSVEEETATNPNGDSEQQTLSESSPAPNPSRTTQEWILSRYHSNKMLQTAIGFWLKLIVEVVIVGVPLFLLIVVLGSVVVYFGFVQGITYIWLIIASATLTTTIIGITWCFTDSTDTI